MSFIDNNFVVNSAIKKGIALALDIKSKHRPSLAFSRRFRKLSKDEQKYIISAILKTQTTSIKLTVESLDKEGIMLPGIGTIKYSKSKAKRIEILSRELRLRGYERFKDVYDPNVRDEIISIVQAELYEYNKIEYARKQEEKRHAPVHCPSSLLSIIKK